MRIRVAGILIKDERILMVRHCKGKDEYWLLPGGGVETGEYLRDALRREVREELGLSVKVKKLLYVFESFADKEKHIIQPTFLMDADKLAFSRSEDRRVCGYSFFGKEELKELRVYPDINDELVELLAIRLENSEEEINNIKWRVRYILKKWRE